MMQTGEAYIDSGVKRSFDIVGASMLAIAAAPLAGVAAIGMRLEEPSLSPFFRQQRVGLGEKSFMVHKLRTLADHDHPCTDTFTTFGPEDPRAAKLAKFVRKLGLDELPQVANIIAGEMSLVGIRPLLESTLEQRQQADPCLFDDWYYCYVRNLGLFGPGQMYARHAGSYQENGAVIRNLMRLDIEGYQTASLQNDIQTIFTQPFTLIRSALRSRPVAA